MARKTNLTKLVPTPVSITIVMMTGLVSSKFWHTWTHTQTALGYYTIDTYPLIWWMKMAQQHFPVYKVRRVVQ